MHYDITHERVDLDSFYSIKISCNLQAKPWYDLRWIIIRGGVLEDVLGLEDVLEDTF